MLQNHNSKLLLGNLAIMKLENVLPMFPSRKMVFDDEMPGGLVGALERRTGTGRGKEEAKRQEGSAGAGPKADSF